MSVKEGIVKAVLQSDTTKEVLKKTLKKAADSKVVQGIAVAGVVTGGLFAVKAANAVIHRIKTSKKVKIGPMEFED